MSSSKNAVLNIGGNVIYLASQLLMIVVVTRAGGFSNTGVFSLAVTITGIFYILSNYNMRSYQVSDVLENYSDSDYFFARLITIVLGILFCAAYCLVEGYRSFQTAVIMLYMGYKSLESFSDLGYGFYQKSGKFHWIFISMALKGIVGIVGFTICFLLTRNLLPALLTLIAAVLAIIVLYDRPRIASHPPRLKSSRDFVPKQVRALLFECFPLMLVLIAQPILQAIPRLCFEKMYSNELFGIYSSISSPAAVITTFVACATMPMLPRLARYYVDGELGKLLKSMLVGLLMIFALGLAAYLVSVVASEFALTLVFGEGVRPYTNIFLLIVMAMTLSSVIMYLNALLTSIRKFALLTAWSFLSCSICWLLTPRFLLRWEMSGIAYVMIVSQAAQVVGMLVSILIVARHAKTSSTRR